MDEYPDWLVKALAEGRAWETGRVRLPDAGLVARLYPDSGRHQPPAGPVELTLPPSTNNLFLTAGRRRVKTPEYRAWIEANAAAARRVPRPDPPPSLDHPVRVVTTVYGNKGFRRSRDVANVEKPVTDLLVSVGVLVDDSVMAGVWESVQRYRPGNPKGGPPVVTVHLERVDPREL